MAEGDCPLCLDPMDETDISIFPCPCGYQVCLYCLDKLKSESNRCPACRSEYDEDKFVYKDTTEKGGRGEDSDGFVRRERSVGVISSKVGNFDRKRLEKVRVLQKNLVYVIGIPLAVGREDILRRFEYFGQYGKILKIVINKHSVYNQAGAYITFEKDEEAFAAKVAVDGFRYDGKVLKASFGTTKYCLHFLSGRKCPNGDCMYLHEFREQDQSFTKEEIVQSKHNMGEPTTDEAQDIFRKLSARPDLAPKPQEKSIFPPVGTYSSGPPGVSQRGYDSQHVGRVPPPTTLADSIVYSNKREVIRTGKGVRGRPVVTVSSQAPHPKGNPLPLGNFVTVSAKTGPRGNAHDKSRDARQVASRPSSLDFRDENGPTPAEAAGLQRTASSSARVAASVGRVDDARAQRVVKTPVKKSPPLPPQKEQPRAVSASTSTKPKVTESAAEKKEKPVPPPEIKPPEALEPRSGSPNDWAPDSWEDLAKDPKFALDSPWDHRDVRTPEKDPWEADPWVDSSAEKGSVGGTNVDKSLLERLTQSGHTASMPSATTDHQVDALGEQTVINTISVAWEGMDAKDRQEISRGLGEHNDPAILKVGSGRDNMPKQSGEQGENGDEWRNKLQQIVPNVRFKEISDSGLRVKKEEPKMGQEMGGQGAQQHLSQSDHLYASFANGYPGWGQMGHSDRQQGGESRQEQGVASVAAFWGGAASEPSKYDPFAAAPKSSASDGVFQDSAIVNAQPRMALPPQQGYIGGIGGWGMGTGGSGSGSGERKGDGAQSQNENRSFDPFGGAYPPWGGKASGAQQDAGAMMGTGWGNMFAGGMQQDRGGQQMVPPTQQHGGVNDPFSGYPGRYPGGGERMMSQPPPGYQGYYRQPHQGPQQGPPHSQF